MVIEQSYPEVTADFGYWLAGLLDGEGCFWIAQRGRGFLVAMGIVLRADDRKTLEHVQERLGMGLIYERSASGNRAPSLIWQINRKSDVLRMVEVLDRYSLRSKKIDDYRIWRIAAMYWGGFRHMPAGEHPILRNAMARLKVGRGYEAAA